MRRASWALAVGFFVGLGVQVVSADPAGTPRSRSALAGGGSGTVDTSNLVDKTTVQSISGTKTFATIKVTEIDAPSTNSLVQVQGDCNPVTTLCTALDVNNVVPSTNNRIQTWSSGGVKKAELYNDGTFSNYPSTISTNICYANKIQDPTGSGGVIVFSDRSAGSVSSDFVVDTANTRTAGALQSWNNAGSSRAQVDPTGMFVGGVGGAGSQAAFQDGTGVSGHPSLTAANGLYPVILGRLGENHDAIETDAGRPRTDGGTDVCTETDGGTYYCYAGRHGDVTSSSSQARYGGWLFEWRNPITSTAADARAFIDFNGGFGQFHQLSLSQFPPCPGYSIITSSGTFAYGATKSTLMYDLGTERWYQCNTAGWKKLKTEDDL